MTRTPPTVDALTTPHKGGDGPGTGMPASLYLDEFGLLVHDVFGEHPYLVGSAGQSKDWRDVDVRLILSDEKYEAWGLGDPRHPQQNAKWVALTLAFAALGQRMTGLPVDFQIQQRTFANDAYKGERRSALGVPAWIRSRRRHGIID